MFITCDSGVSFGMFEIHHEDHNISMFVKHRTRPLCESDFQSKNALFVDFSKVAFILNLSHFTKGKFTTRDNQFGTNFQAEIINIMFSRARLFQIDLSQIMFLYEFLTEAKLYLPITPFTNFWACGYNQIGFVNVEWLVFDGVWKYRKCLCF